ncbi:manganese-transporting P-type ATPase [Marchantia polymorpha subsp. ruderalis]|uniref:Cation-transporting ATPase n=2 Tax=Marchantia polymorpha TaxID=3197 RepID=A0A176WM28_MARPO|nr:hypothetical protein AXG93_1200s1680 [Marchantia polymorpha subsp. ruderalis]PTQ49892.1 hypothetical protein MARPO_0002s0327 [Marchantia polymorpha]BBM99987.1 hypothetical protein Mp_1g25450 [Marchantia polymorpha subsp. ruderalis]|eukprot:PTQ49892.1 hypothetical protein MARPO_0002s0327 [Marchantia polymorpha]
MAIPVNSKVVKSVELYRWRATAWRLDMWPFAGMYGAWLVMSAPQLDPTDSGIILGCIVLSHILTWLFTAWSVDFRCFMHAEKVRDVHLADVCKVVPAKFSGSKEVVPLHQRKISPGEKLNGFRDGSQLLTSKQSGSPAPSATQAGEEIGFEFRKQQFIYSEEENKFFKLDYPNKEPFGTYSKLTGYGSETRAQVAMEKWGRNIFEFPQPTFGNLMKEHCMEPFFVFQVFCVGLWCLDDYWYYSVFTLLMLILFESTVVKSRLKTLQELRRVRVDSQTLMVHRGGKWMKLSGMDLLPGDVVSIGRPTGQGSEERTVPADMLLIAGSAIANEALLTGESTPQWKGSIVGREPGDRLSIRRDKNHVLFGGTKILQHTPDKTGSLKAPDGGCLAVVLRTGFETSQGKLMRTILFSTERVTANNWESGLFICFLVVFALIAAGYVLKKGLDDPNRSKYKLFLNCSLIITSVIPPELPMELSIAVNTSLIALAKKGIYCTEPFRIPFAGKVDVCCFDKTGTLTSDDMEFRGVVVLSESLELEADSSKFSNPTVQALASCHALVFVDNKLVGDPLEKAALKGVDWSYTADEKAIPRKGSAPPVQIMARHHFASHLKRMSVVTRIDENFFCFVKGAPETIQERLTEVYPGYVEAYKQFTRQGSRVIALAYKRLPEMTVGDARSLDREEVETGLSFAGFAVFACPLRHDSATVLKELKESSHDLVMITGDQALTACHVAAQVHIITRSALILTPHADESNEDTFNWISPDEKVKLPYKKEEVLDISNEYDLCVAGDGLGMLQRTHALEIVIPVTKVFARVAPDQKELILTTLKAVGRTALMCGDGTNDVGALKQAHVGVALLNAIPPVKAANASSSTNTEPGSATLAPSATTPSTGQVNKAKRSKSAIAGPSGIAGAVQSGASSSGAVTRPVKVGLPTGQQNPGKTSPTGQGGPGSKPLTPAELQKLKLKKMMDELNEEGDGRSAPTVKLGDASMAAPFTAKHSSVRPTTDIIRQGRSTLVTTLQMFKILGLNCLATAYVLSVMHLDGVKLGDMQATISGVFTAAFFLFISHARPLNTLSAQRPHPNIFSPYVILSLLGQFAIHITFLVTVVNGAKKYMPEECIEPDSEFTPNLVNTVSYMSNMMIQVATFAVNYIGHPFNQSIRENKPFYFALTSAAIFFTALLSDLFRSLNDWLRLVPLPQPYGRQVLGYAAAMVAGCYLWEHSLRWVFPPPSPTKPRQRRRAVSKPLESKKRD